MAEVPFRAKGETLCGTLSTTRYILCEKKTQKVKVFSMDDAPLKKLVVVTNKGFG